MSATEKTPQSEKEHKTGKRFQGEGKSLLENSSKKSSTNRHSYNPSNHSNYMHHNSFEFNHFDPHFLSRERSFIRPLSKANQMDGPMELHRQRSFVIPGQLQYQKQENRKRSGQNHTNQRGGKPAMEIYRPPKSQTKGNFNGYNGSRPGLNIHAKEFVMVSEASAIQHSKSSGNIMLFQQHQKPKLQHSKSGQNIRGNGHESSQTSPPRVHFCDNKENLPDSKNTSRPPSLALASYSGAGNPVKRSKSLGSADFRNPTIGDRSPLSDIGPFAQDVQNTISKAINDPNTLSARQLMDVIRHVFNRVVEASRYAEPTARLCITIVEKEKGETFLETLLNTCQEYFHERDRLLRNATPGPYPGYVASHPRWIAYMSFLNEMYTQLKRRHVQLMTKRMQNSETPPGLLLLTLLAQCCHVCLREQAVNSLAETECLFFVLTAVGKDIEVEIPNQMGRVMGAARDAFLTKVHVPAVKKTLLQLIEMHAARWQLPASAVMYYYPGAK